MSQLRFGERAWGYVCSSRVSKLDELVDFGLRIAVYIRVRISGVYGFVRPFGSSGTIVFNINASSCL